MDYGPHLHLLAGKLLGIEELILHLRSPRGHHIAVLQNRINDLGIVVSLEERGTVGQLQLLGQLGQHIWWPKRGQQGAETRRF